MKVRLLLVLLLITGLLAAAERPDEYYDADVQRLIATPPYFAFGPVGPGGNTSEGEEAFGVIVQKKEAIKFIMAAFEHGTDYSRCYMLVALRESSPAMFTSAMGWYRKHGPKSITTQAACDRREVALKDLCDAIESGKYAAYFKMHEEKKG